KEKCLEPVPSEPPRQAPIEQISNKESIPVEKYNKITSDRLASLKETSSYAISDIQQMLAELEELEEKENQKGLRISNSGNPVYPTTFSARPQDSSPVDSDRSEFLQLFIEM